MTGDVTGWLGVGDRENDETAIETLGHDGDWVLSLLDYWPVSGALLVYPARMVLVGITIDGVLRVAAARARLARTVSGFLTHEVSGMTEIEKSISDARHRVELLVGRLLCWWFGCDPDYDHPCRLSPNYVVPCKRCKAHDTDYACRIGDTKHNRLMGWLRYWFFRRWWPKRCSDCGNRFGTHHDCLPF